MHNKREKKLIKLIESLLNKAVSYGVSLEGKIIVDEFLEYNEFGLAFEHIVYELTENNIGITSEYYKEIIEVAYFMEINEKEYQPSLAKLIIG